MAATNADSKVVDLSDYRRRAAGAQRATAPGSVAQPVVFIWMPVVFVVPLWCLS